MISYTPATVEMIRAHSASGRSRRDLMALTGWGAGMLDRICERHRISLAGSVDDPIEHNVVVASEPAKFLRPKSPVNITICISPATSARLHEDSKDGSISRYISALLRWSLAANFPNWKRYRGDQRVEYVTVQMRPDEKLQLTEAATQRGESVSPFCAAIIEQHLDAVIR